MYHYYQTSVEQQDTFKMSSYKYLYGLIAFLNLIAFVVFKAQRS